MPTLAELDRKTDLEQNIHSQKSSHGPETPKLIKDAQEIYHVKHLPLNYENQGMLLEANKVILKWQVLPNNVIFLDVYCSEQLIIWDKFDCLEFTLQAKGPVYFTQPFTCAGNLTVNAQSVAFQEPVHCTASIIINTRKGTGFYASVQSKSSHIDAEEIYHFTQCYHEEKAVFTCKNYVGNEIYSPVLHLSAEDAQISGCSKITQQCRISVDKLSFGHPSLASSIHISGEIALTVNNLTVQETTELAIEGEKNKAVLQINQQLNLAGSLQLRQVKMQSLSLLISGFLHANNTQFAGDKLVNLGILHIQQSNLALMKLVHDGKQLIVENCDAFIQEMIHHQGEINYAKSLLVGNEHFLLAGQLSITDNTVLCFQRFQVCKEAIFQAKASAIEGDKISLAGQIHCQQTRIQAGKLSLYTDQALFEKLDLWVGNFAIHGSSQPENVRFMYSVLTVKNSFSTLSPLTLKYSSLFLLGDKHAIQLLAGKLVLQESKLITNNTLLQSAQRELFVGRYSLLMAAEIASFGHIISNFAQVFAERLTQVKGKLSTRNSHLQFKNAYKARQTEVSLTHTKLKTSTLNLQQTPFSLTTKSSLLIGDFLSHDRCSPISALNSMISTKHVNSLGEVHLTRSLFYASRWAQISSVVKANHSKINIKSLINVGNEAAITLSNAILQAKAMIHGGKISLQNGCLAIESDLLVKQEGLVNLLPNSIVKANEFNLFGQLHIQEPKQEVSINAEFKPAQLKLDKQFTIRPQAKLMGDSPFVIQSDICVNRGSIISSNPLVSQGSLFFNEGLLQGDSLYISHDWLINTYKMVIKQMMLQGNLLNPLGLITVDETMTSSGLVECNLGIIAANNYQSSNLISANLGLVLPNFPTDSDLKISNKKLRNFAQALGTFFIPQGLNKWMHLASTITNLLQSLQTLYGQFDNFNLAAICRLKRYEWVPFFTQLYLWTMLGKSTFSRLNLSTLKQAFSKFSEMQGIDIFVKAARVFTGFNRQTNLFQLNSGFHLGGSSSELNLIHVNTGFEGALSTTS